MPYIARDFDHSGRIPKVGVYFAYSDVLIILVESSKGDNLICVPIVLVEFPKTTAFISRFPSIF